MNDVAVSSSPRRPRKSEETRQRILEVALELFRQNGFEQTTMRDIASAGGIALGATYYYFGSKEAIVLAYYDLAKDDMMPRLEDILMHANTLESGLKSTFELKLAYYKPNRKFLGALFPHVADLRDPLSPFSEASRHIRQADYLHYQNLLDKTKTPLPNDLAPYMPALLWLYQMAVLLFWIHDRTDDQKRTSALISKSLKVAVRLLRLSRLPGARPLRRMFIDLLNVVMRPTESASSEN